jgi:hypothetical protein
VRFDATAAAIVLVAAVGVGCSGDDDSATATSTSVARATTSTSNSTMADTDCGGAPALLKMFLAETPEPQRFRVSRFVVSTTDPSWVRMDVPPPVPNPERTIVDGTSVSAHCENGTWRINNSGTSGVGCEPGVPPAVVAEIGLDC